MEKLVELLNKFEKEKIIKDGGYVDEDDEYFGRSLKGGDIVNRSFDPDAHGFFKYQIISKDFKFIERLIKNDKIELEELKWHFMDLWELAGNTEFILMLLSIQDEPLQFLSKIIK